MVQFYMYPVLDSGFWFEFDKYVCSSFRADVTYGVILLYYIIIIYYYIIIHILYYTLPSSVLPLLFPNLSSFLPPFLLLYHSFSFSPLLFHSSSVPLPSSYSLSQSIFLFFPPPASPLIYSSPSSSNHSSSPHSKYTCRHLDILTYTLPAFPNI